MSSQKRGGGYSHYGDRNRAQHNHHAHQHPNKKQRPNQPAHHSNHGRGPHYVLTNTIPEPELSSTDMHSGLVALLDRFVAAETTPAADREILEHASELRRLLSERRVHTPSATAKQDLDKKRPDNGTEVVIPPYIHRKVREAAELPPLPPITESHILEAVFTHQSVHQTTLTDHNGINLGLDYERFELLGDAYIELMATRALYNRFPQVDIPQLSSWRERLVENLTLGKFAEAYGFPDRLKAKAKWDKDTKAWKKVVADIFEAYVAGLVLSDPEHGFERAEEWLDTLWAPQLLTFKEKVVENARARDDLQKLIFLNTVKIDYREERPMTYENGAQRYFIGIYFTGWDYKDEWLGSGEGQNKAAAAISAATDAIKRNNEVLQGATRKKAELMEVKAKEREEAKKQAAAAETQEDRAQDGSADAAATNARESTDRRDNEDNISEKKKKKHKTDKKRKPSADE